MVLVRETMMADWQAWRNIRLQALRDAPDAFASTRNPYDREPAATLTPAGCASTPRRLGG